MTKKAQPIQILCSFFSCQGIYSSMVFRLNAITVAFFSVLLTSMPVHAAQAPKKTTVKLPNQFKAGVFDQRCYSNVPPATETEYGLNTPVEVSAKQLNATRNGKAIYQGGVQVNQGNKYFSSDYTELDQATRNVNAHGNIYYRDGQVTLQSKDKLTSNLDTKVSKIDNATYQIHGSPARGKAKQIQVDNQKNEAVLQKAEFTTCPPGQESWWLSASEVNLDQKEVFGEAWNATLWLKHVPVFYTPYITFPIKDQRKSGLLYPTFTYSSSNGFDVSTPYYWNIAPNYDLTYTPRMIESRGFMQQVEYRYMPAAGHSGVAYLEYMANDKKMDSSDEDSHARWLANLKHTSRFDDGNLVWNLDYTRVDAQDYDYFNDLNPPVDQRVDNQLMQSSSLAYYQDDWNLKGEVRDYQILLPNQPQPFKLLPQLSYNQYFNTDYYDFSVSSELANFDNAGTNSTYKAYTGQRTHIEPTLKVPLLLQPGYSLDAEAKLMATYYHQDIPDDLGSYYKDTLGMDNLKSNVSRTLPEIKIHGGMTFDRDTSFNDHKYTQTLEPEVQYLYIPYRNQNDIGIYDTTTTMSDYYSLFSDRRFAGLDRISDANRVSTGITTRFIDDEETERVRLTVGQSYDLVAPKVTLYPKDEANTNSRSLLAVRADTHPTNNWYTHTELEYNTQEKEVSAGNGAVEYQQDRFTSQMNYRYVSKEYLNETETYAQTTDEDISQLGSVIKIPVNADWQVIGAHYFNTETGKSIDSLLGARYDSCCWAVNLTFERRNKANNTDGTSKAETSYGLQFEFKGLGSVGNGPAYKMDTHLIPYSRPFNLND
jgi:LPS-assembly protein